MRQRRRNDKETEQEGVTADMHAQPRRAKRSVKAHLAGSVIGKGLREDET